MAAALAAALLLPASAPAQLGTPVSDPVPVLDAGHPAIAAFAARLAADVAADSVGSLTAAVVVGDRVVWAGGFGVRDREARAPARPGTIYRVGSITKVVTAAALMRLVERGVIVLDEPVAVALPEIVHLAHLRTTARPITYRDLASHRSGLAREPSSTHAGRGRRRGWRGRALSSIPLTEAQWPPGETYVYSNIGYAILGLAMERAADRRFETLVAEEVLGPLGMTRSSFGIPEGDRGRVAAGYVNLDDGTIDPRVPRAEHGGRGYREPSEGLYSTAGDLARLIMGLSGALGDTLLSAESRAAMLTDHEPGGEDGADRAGYGLGLQLTRIGNRLLASHSGTVAGYTSYLVFDPATRVGVVLLRSYNRGATNLGAEAQRVVLELASDGADP